MNCPKCNHEEEYHGQKGCVLCDCDMAPMQIEAEAGPCCCLQYVGDNPNCKVHPQEVVDVAG